MHHRILIIFKFSGIQINYQLFSIIIPISIQLVMNIGVENARNAHRSLVRKSPECTSGTFSEQHDKYHLLVHIFVHVARLANTFPAV